MSTDKKFSVAGVSTLAGKTKIRFANDSMRIKILAKNGHTNVDLINLPHEMTKGEIAAYLTQVGFGSARADVQAAIAYIAKRNPVAVVPTAAPEKAAVTA